MSTVNNLLSPINFVFRIADAPKMEYLVQKVNIPGVTLGTADIPTPFVKLSQPGNISYDPLRVEFKVSEELESYLEIYNWMVTLGHPDDLGQYKNRRSDLSVLILNSAKRPIMNVTFTNAYPINLTPIDLDVTMETLQYVTSMATFNFDRMYYNSIS